MLTYSCVPKVFGPPISQFDLDTLVDREIELRITFRTTKKMFITRIEKDSNAVYSCKDGNNPNWVVYFREEDIKYIQYVDKRDVLMNNILWISGSLAILFGLYLIISNMGFGMVVG